MYLLKFKTYVFVLLNTTKWCAMYGQIKLLLLLLLLLLIINSINIKVVSQWSLFELKNLDILYSFTQQWGDGIFQNSLTQNKLYLKPGYILKVVFWIRKNIKSIQTQIIRNIFNQSIHRTLWLFVNWTIFYITPQRAS